MHRFTVLLASLMFSMFPLLANAKRSGAHAGGHSGRFHPIRQLNTMIPLPCLRA